MMAMMINQRVLFSNRLQKQLFIIVPPKIAWGAGISAPLLSYYDEGGKMCKEVVGFCLVLSKFFYIFLLILNYIRVILYELGLFLIYSEKSPLLFFNFISIISSGNSLLALI